MLLAQQSKWNRLWLITEHYKTAWNIFLFWNCLNFAGNSRSNSSTRKLDWQPIVDVTITIVSITRSSWSSSSSSSSSLMVVRIFIIDWPLPFPKLWLLVPPPPCWKAYLHKDSGPRLLYTVSIGKYLRNFRKTVVSSAAHVLHHAGKYCTEDFEYYIPYLQSWFEEH